MSARLHDIAYLELWVEDAQAVASSYEQIFGLEIAAIAGPDTGLAGHRSVFLTRGSVRFFVTSSVDAQGPVAEFVKVHGDGVRDIAFAVDDAPGVLERALAGGAEPNQVRSPIWDGTPRVSIRTFGDVVHSLVPTGHALPACFRALPGRPDTHSTSPCSMVAALDHVAMCLPPGQLDQVAEFYKRAFGFADGHQEYVETELSGMNARVVHCGPIKFPLQEPLVENPSGPIAEFIELNRGAGVYHVGLLTRDICATMRSLRGRVKALDVPDAYYDQVPARVGALDEDLAALRELQILVDRDDKGYLLQTFTRSLHPRQTFFIEIIQRKGDAEGFGSANIRALFDAVEADRLGLAASAAKSDTPPERGAIRA